MYRFTGSLIVDDFQIDKKDRLTSADGLGKLVRLAYTMMSDPFYLTLLSSYVRLDTYTLQHSYGFCNWVKRGALLGHPIGNDADQISAGLRVVLRQPVSLEIQFGRCRWGDNSLLLDDRQYTPYQRYIRQPFPSGEMRENRFISVTLDSQPIQRLAFGITGHIDINHHGLDSGLEKWTFQLRYQIPFIFVQ